jgi:DNA-binding winged helix-turn-helix (wHTH) protein
MICFDRFTLDLDRGSLRQSGREVWLRPKTLAVLRHLAENAGRLVSKRELFATLWPDVAVTDDSLVQCIVEIRRALGADCEGLVRTIARRGYLFDTAVSCSIEHNEIGRSAGSPVRSLDAWEYYNRGLWHYAKAEAAENELALRFFERAVELEAGFAAAHAAIARALATAVVRYQVPAARPIFISRAIDHARRSVACDPAAAVGHGALALMLLHMGQHDEASAEADLAVNLDPNSAFAYGYQGASRAFGGRPHDAIEPLETAMQLSPFDPLRLDWLHYFARARYWTGDYPAAHAAARQLCRSSPGFRPAYGILIASLGQLRQPKEAQRVARDAIKRFGNGYPARLRRKPPEFRLRDHQHLVEGWRMAGLPAE